jgi:hypothetical protein
VKPVLGTDFITPAAGVYRLEDQLDYAAMMLIHRHDANQR